MKGRRQPKKKSATQKRNTRAAGTQKKATAPKPPRIYMTPDHIRAQLRMWASRLHGFVPRDQLPQLWELPQRPLPELHITDGERLAFASFLEQLALPPPDRRGKPTNPKTRGRRLHMAVAYDLWKRKWTHENSKIPSEEAIDAVQELWGERKNRVLDAYGKQIKKGKGLHRKWAADTLRIARRLNPELRGFAIVGPFCARLRETTSEGYSWATFATDPVDWLRRLSGPGN